MQECPALSKFSEHDDNSDERLVQRVAAGDRVAMQRLYTRHHVRVYRFVLRIVYDAATAEDLTSDAFLDVWKNAGCFEGRSQVSTWILSIARNKALATLRRRANDPLDEEIASKIPDDAEGLRTTARFCGGCVCRKPRPFDLMKESRNVGHDGRAALLPFEAVGFAV